MTGDVGMRVGTGHQKDPASPCPLQKQLVAPFPPPPGSTRTPDVPDAFLILQTCNFLEGEDAVLLISSFLHKNILGVFQVAADTRICLRDNCIKVIQGLIKEVS